MERCFEQNEVDFFLDMAANECQRWLEVTCREIFIDNDDFIYSLCHGCHLRKIVNKIIPDCFDVTTERFKKAPRKTQKILRNAGVRQMQMEEYIEDEDWASQLLLICWCRLKVPLHRLFHPQDLFIIDHFNGPYKLFIEQSSVNDELRGDDSETIENGKIRRLCSTIACLADECNRVNLSVPKLDKSAVEPLLQYNDWISSQHQISTLFSHNPLHFPALEIVSTLASVIDQICLTEEQYCRSETLSASSDEGIDTMVECNYSVNKYLADGSSEYSTEDMSNYSIGSKSSRSCSPYVGERCFSSSGEQQIPTRPHVKLTSQVAHNPLQFISSRTTAVALREQAKQQIVVSEEQKRLRAEALQMMQSSFNADEESAWQSNLDSWLSKRKCALSKTQKVSGLQTTRSAQPEMNETKLMMVDIETVSKNTNEFAIQEKEEILTVASSPIADEHTDSGIENNRASSSYQHSPSTSSGFSPQTEWNNSREYDHIGSTTEKRKYFTQTNWHSEGTSGQCADDVSPRAELRSSSQHSERAINSTNNDTRSDRRVGSRVETLLQIDKNQLQILEDKANIKQEQISQVNSSEHSTLSDSFGSKVELNCAKSVPSSSRKGTVSEIAAKFECSNDNEAKQRVEKVVPITCQYRMTNSLQKFEKNSSPEAKQPTAKQPFSETQQTNYSVTLEVELCREQTANVATLKYPSPIQQTTNLSSELYQPKPIHQRHQIESPHQKPQQQQSTKPLYTFNDPSQAPSLSSSCISYTSANLTSLKEKHSSSHQQLSKETSQTSGRIAEEEKPEEKLKNSFSESVRKKFEDNVTKITTPAMNKVHIPFGNTSSSTSYRSGSRDQFNGPVLNNENVTDDNVMTITIDSGHNTTKPHRYFGFTVAGGKDKDSALRVETVIPGTPAEEYGLKAGDLILSINGESVEDRYHQTAIRMIHEAARLGEVELKIRRPSYGLSESERMIIASPRSTSEQHRECYDDDGMVSFDEKRSMFDKKTNDENNANNSYNQFKQLKKHQQQTFKWTANPSVVLHAVSTPTFQQQANGPTPITDSNASLAGHQMSNINKLDAVTNSVRYGFQADHSAASSRPASTRSPSLSPYEEDCADFETAPRDRCSTFGSSTDSAIFESSLPFGSSLNSTRSSPRSNNADYRVTSMHDKPEPGKLSDFIPEVERSVGQRNQQSCRGNEYDEVYKRRERENECGHVVSGLSSGNGIQPKVVRNYDVTPCRSTTISPIPERTLHFTKRANEVTYIPLSKKSPPVPQKPCTTFTPPSSLPPDEGAQNGANEEGADEMRPFVDSREWRQIIEQQRLPNAGDSSNRNRVDADSKFRIVHSSAGSLKESLSNSSSWSSQSTRPHPPTDTTRLNRAEPNTGSESRRCNVTAPTSILRTSVEVLHKFPEEVQSHSADSNETMPARSFKSGRDERFSESKSSEHVVAVSGKNKCSHCGKELGRGAAMIIESLSLFYHLSCFRCYVCNTPLGNGRQGADVRVRDSKLHCQRCYSNDEAGLKFSQV